MDNMRNYRKKDWSSFAHSTACTSSTFGEKEANTVMIKWCRVYGKERMVTAQIDANKRKKKSCEFHFCCFRKMKLCTKRAKKSNTDEEKKKKPFRKITTITCVRNFLCTLDEKHSFLPFNAYTHKYLPEPRCCCWWWWSNTNI